MAEQSRGNTTKDDREDGEIVEDSFDEISSDEELTSIKSNAVSKNNSVGRSYKRGTDIPIHVHSLVYKRAGKHSAEFLNSKLRPIVDTKGKEVNSQMLENRFFLDSGAHFCESNESYNVSLMNFKSAISLCRQNFDNIHEKENRSSSESSKHGKKHKHHSYESYSRRSSSSGSHERHSPSYVSLPQHLPSSTTQQKHLPTFTSPYNHKHRNLSIPHKRHSPHKHSASHRKHHPPSTTSLEDSSTEIKITHKSKSGRKRRTSVKQTRVTKKTKSKPNTDRAMHKKMFAQNFTKRNYLRSLKTRIENMMNPSNDLDVIDITDEVALVEPPVEIIVLDSPEEGNEPKTGDYYNENINEKSAKYDDDQIENLDEGSAKCDDDQIENLDEGSAKCDDGDQIENLNEIKTECDSHMKNNLKEQENMDTSPIERSKTVQDDEELQLRLLALRSAMLKKHSKRSKTALVTKSNDTNNEDRSNSIQSSQVPEAQNDIVIPVDMEIAESEDESDSTKSVKIIEENNENVDNSGLCSLPLRSSNEQWSDQKLMSYEFGVSSEINSFVNDSHQIPANNFSYEQFFPHNENYHSSYSENFFNGNDEIHHGHNISYKSHVNSETDSRFEYTNSRDSYTVKNDSSNNNSEAIHVTHYFCGANPQIKLEHPHQKHDNERNSMEEYSRKWSEFFSYDTYSNAGSQVNETVFSNEEYLSVRNTNLHDRKRSNVRRNNIENNPNAWNCHVTPVERESYEHPSVRSTLPFSHGHASYINKVNENKLQNESFKNFKKHKANSNNLAVWKSKKAKLQRGPTVTLSRNKRIVNSVMNTKLQSKYKNRRIIPKALTSAEEKVNVQNVSMKAVEQNNKNPFSLKVTVPTKKTVYNSITSDQRTAKRFVICLENESESEDEEEIKETSASYGNLQPQISTSSSVQSCSEEKTANFSAKHALVSADLEKSVDTFLKELRQRQEQGNESVQNNLMSRDNTGEKLPNNTSLGSNVNHTLSKSLLILPSSQQEEYRRLREQLDKLEKENRNRRQQLVARSPQKQNVNRNTSFMTKKMQILGKNQPAVNKDVLKISEPRSVGNAVSSLNNVYKLPLIISANSATGSDNLNNEFVKSEVPAIVSQNITHSVISTSDNTLKESQIGDVLNAVHNPSSDNTCDKLQNKSPQLKCVVSNNVLEISQSAVKSKGSHESCEKSHKAATVTKSLTSASNFQSNDKNNSSDNIRENKRLNKKITVSECFTPKMRKCNADLILSDYSSVKCLGENKQNRNTKQEKGNIQTVDLSDCEMELLNKRYKTLDEITKALDSFRCLEEEHKTEEKLNADVIELREKLAAAELQLQNQKKLVGNIRSDIPNIAFRVKESTSSCFMLTRKCLLLGIKSHGKHYKVPNTGAELLKSKLRHLQQCLKKVKLINDGKIQEDTIKGNVDNNNETKLNYCTDSGRVLEHDVNGQNKSEISDFVRISASHKINEIVPTDATDVLNDVKENIMLVQNVPKLSNSEKEVMKETVYHSDFNETITPKTLSITKVINQSSIDSMMIQQNTIDKTLSQTITLSTCNDTVPVIQSAVDENCCSDRIRNQFVIKEIVKQQVELSTVGLLPNMSEKIMEATADADHSTEIVKSETDSPNCDGIILEPSVKNAKGTKNTLDSDCCGFITDENTVSLFDGYHCDVIKSESIVMEVESETVANQDYCDDISKSSVSDNCDRMMTEPVISNLTVSKTLDYSKHDASEISTTTENIQIMLEGNYCNDTFLKHIKNEETTKNMIDLDSVDCMIGEENNERVDSEFNSSEITEKLDNVNENYSNQCNGLISEPDIKSNTKIEFMSELHDHKEKELEQNVVNKTLLESGLDDDMLRKLIVPDEVVTEGSVKSNLNGMLSECIEINNRMIQTTKSNVKKETQNSVQLHHCSTAEVETTNTVVQYITVPTDCEDRVIEPCTLVIQNNTVKPEVSNDNGVELYLSDQIVTMNTTDSMPEIKTELENSVSTAVLNSISDVELSSQPVSVSTENLLCNQLDITHSAQDLECGIASVMFRENTSQFKKIELSDEDGCHSLPPKHCDLYSSYSGDQHTVNDISDSHHSDKDSNQKRQIDPHLPICPFDLMGSCYDEDCKFQHLQWPSDNE